jgi:UDP-N-acetylglucosamine/UDP-N-acetylgalactosamine diphosphorylase
MYQRGIKYLPQYCVDNAVVKVADPVFLGYCIAQGADVGGKALAKVSWDEKVRRQERRRPRFCGILVCFTAKAR